MKRAKDLLQFSFLGSLLSFVVYFLVGCNSGVEEDSMGIENSVSHGSHGRSGATHFSKTLRSEKKDTPIHVQAGVPVEAAQAMDPIQLRENSKSSTHLNAVTLRTSTLGRDPFGLHPEEKSFYDRLRTEKLFGEIGGFMPYVAPPEVKAFAQESVFEKLPFTRLAGVILADGIQALIEVDGGHLHAVKAGQKVPGTEWYLDSVNKEEVVLKRKGLALPKEVTIHLSDEVDIEKSDFPKEDEGDDGRIRIGRSTQGEMGDDESDESIEEENLRDLDRPFYQLPKSFSKNYRESRSVSTKKLGGSSNKGSQSKDHVEKNRKSREIDSLGSNKRIKISVPQKTPPGEID